MATSRKSSKDASGGGPRKATPAGRKSKTSPTRTAGRRRTAAAEDGAAAPAPVHLHAVPADTEGEVAAPDTSAAADDTSDPRFKRPDLIEAVSQRTALKRSDAKVVLELVLDELGRALDRNEELVLPPLGKLVVKKRKPDADGPDVLTLKLRRPRDAGSEAGSEGGDSPLADPDEDG